MLKAQARAHTLATLFSWFNCANWLRDRNPFFLVVKYTISICGSVRALTKTLFYRFIFSIGLFPPYLFIYSPFFFSHPENVRNGLNTEGIVSSEISSTNFANARLTHMRMLLAIRVCNGGEFFAPMSNEPRTHQMRPRPKLSLKSETTVFRYGSGSEVD